MVLITIIVLVPYALYNLYLFLLLQHPEYLSLATLGLYSPRKAVGLTDPRQILIVGTISGGTKQISVDLKEKLGLEIGHENSETSWSFVRDGTVSWFHGIRFLPRPKGNGNGDGDNNGDYSLFQSVTRQLCQDLTSSMGFHPYMFRDSKKCSLREKWNDCWRSECRDILRMEWACALRPNKNGGLSNDNEYSSKCETPYRRSLHQVRHPLRTIESLVTKFCIGGVEGRVQPPFLTFAGALFPQHNFHSMSCIEAAGYYFVEYHSAMVHAYRSKYIDGWYRVEDVTPCDVVRMAGFLDDDVVFELDQGRLSQICNGDPDHAANMLMKSSANRYNVGLLSLDWDDLRGGKHGSKKELGDHDLEKKVNELAASFGYI